VPPCAMTGSPLRRLQELAAVLRGRLAPVRERRRRRIWRAACQSAVNASVASKPRWSVPETVKLVTDVAVRSLLIMT
jgi:hypothetical protein